MGWLHRLLYSCAQVGTHRLQVELVSEPAGEGVQGPGRVVAVAVEASVDDGLVSLTGGAEEGGDRQRGSSDG